MIKYWDYIQDFKSNKKKIIERIIKTIESGSLLFGKELDTFEKKMSKYHNLKFGIGVSSGTDALLIALKTFNFKKGDEIITVANTAIPTVSAIQISGSRPVFVDIGDDYLIDVNKIEKKITSRTKAIIVVHLFGQVCDMSKILSISKKYNLKIIEDCAQSFGAKYKNRICGTFGDASCFSFYPTKVLGSYGDAGFVFFRKKKDYFKGKRIRFYGIETDKHFKQKKKYFSIENGINSRLSEIQAAILNFKIKNIKKEINARKKIAKYYFDHLKTSEYILPKTYSNRDHVFHIFPILSNKRINLVKFLRKKKIQTSINYPYPIHKMPTFKNNICENCDCLKKTEEFSKKILSLPIYPSLKTNDLKKIVSCLKSFK